MLSAELQNMLHLKVSLANPRLWSTELGYMTGGMWFICTAQWLYSNAVMKGEECIPSTWDIFYEKVGF